jgi:hypothetical protein
MTYSAGQASIVVLASGRVRVGGTTADGRAEVSDVGSLVGHCVVGGVVDGVWGV